MFFFQLGRKWAEEEHSRGPGAAPAGKQASARVAVPFARRLAAGAGVPALHPGPDKPVGRAPGQATGSPPPLRPWPVSSVEQSWQRGHGGAGGTGRSVPPGGKEEEEEEAGLCSAVTPTVIPASGMPADAGRAAHLPSRAERSAGSLPAPLSSLQGPCVRGTSRPAQSKAGQDVEAQPRPQRQAAPDYGPDCRRGIPGGSPGSGRFL